MARAEGERQGRETRHRARRFGMTVLGSAMLAGCGGNLNLLEALDGPYVSPSERAEQQAAAEQAAAEEQAADAAAISDALFGAAEAPEPVTAPPVVAEAPAATLAAQESAAGATSRIGPDFLPPETPAADLAAPVLPAAIEADATPTMPASTMAAGPAFGPQLDEDASAPAPLATRLPSAFDYTAPPRRRDEDQPPPAARPAEAIAPPSVATETAVSSALERAAAEMGMSVVSAMPAPTSSTQPNVQADALAGALADVLPRGGYGAFYHFALERLDAPAAGGARESMLLLDPPSLDPALQRCGNLPPAVLVDLDPANGLLPLVSRRNANPELAAYLASLRERGVTIYWISGHGPSAARQIRERLAQSALDPSGADPLIVTRFAGESKQERRYALGESNCLLAILGDQRADFDELYDYVLDPIMASPLEEHINRGWFIAPPPLD